ncbi:uncharacterized protein pre-mod(mdg4)-W [Drosophila kikkawai]|uniref:Uncharacterized protein pre-mod(Mdg4)-W n=1 Tax=Drosophila kikkawai TaxID=30033 RepID=A0A6P4IKT8_DROKI
MDFIPKIYCIRGQRKSVQLMYDRYAYAKNNRHGCTTYWNCRHRRIGHEPCNARLSTTKLPSGNFKVFLSKPEHNHPPSKRLRRQYD